MYSNPVQMFTWHCTHVHLEIKTQSSRAVKPLTQSLLILEGWQQQAAPKQPVETPWGWWAAWPKKVTQRLRSMRKGEKTLLWGGSLSRLMSQETGAAALCALVIWTAEFPSVVLMPQYQVQVRRIYREELMKGWWRKKTKSRANTLLWPCKIRV